MTTTAVFVDTSAWFASVVPSDRNHHSASRIAPVGVRRTGRLEIDADSPVIFIANETTPITFAFRARYACLRRDAAGRSARI
jgi:hypothetical protein